MIPDTREVPLDVFLCNLLDQFDDNRLTFDQVSDTLRDLHTKTGIEAVALLSHNPRKLRICVRDGIEVITIS